MLALASFAVLPAAAQQKADPDWPCMQPKVPELSAAAVWSGPEVDVKAFGWQEDKDVADLASQLASRRVPVDDAVAALGKFVDGLATDQKAAKLSEAFVGAFQLLNRERDQVMQGIDRYARAQKGLAETIRENQSRLSDLNSAGTDPQQISALTDEVTTQVRIFNDRRASLTYVCEVPTLIEQRLFTLAKAIQGKISG